QSKAEMTDQGKINVFVQAISDNVMRIYENLPKMTNKTKDTRLAILKTTKVQPDALINSLEDYMSNCKDAELKEEIGGVKHSIRNLFPGGETRLFVCHSKHNIK